MPPRRVPGLLLSLGIDCSSRTMTGTPIGEVLEQLASW